MKIEETGVKDFQLFFISQVGQSFSAPSHCTNIAQGGWSG
jgi:hypothetical protein